MGTIRVTIIEEVAADRFILGCARCEGSGRGYFASGNRSTDPCRVCGGRGVLLVRLIDGQLPFVQCARCEGTGRGYFASGNRSTDPCMACDGSGAQPIVGGMEVLTQGG